MFADSDVGKVIFLFPKKIHFGRMSIFSQIYGTKKFRTRTPKEDADVSVKPNMPFSSYHENAEKYIKKKKKTGQSVTFLNYCILVTR
jgi:hypothetical protein